MSKEIPLYEWSKSEAKRLDELDEWQLSYDQNCDCARNIEKVINECYKDNSLSDKGAKAIIEKFGYDRVNWVLANTIQNGDYDGRYSPENKAWAKTFYIPHDEKRLLNNFTVKSHPGLVNLFTDQVRKYWDSLGMFSKSHCYDESGGQLDYTGQVLALKPSVLKDEFKNLENQLFYASGGNGCSPNSLGRKVFGQYLNDGESTYYFRTDFLGAVRLDQLPEWAQNKYNELTSQKEEQGIGEQQ